MERPATRHLGLRPATRYVASLVATYLPALMTSCVPYAPSWCLSLPNIISFFLG